MAKISQKQLNALRNCQVPAGASLNPFGCMGFHNRKKYKESWFDRLSKPAYREAAMKRKRVKLKVKKAIALEAHELQQLARENALLAMETLTEISRNKRSPEATRIAASTAILDRAYGKASQTSITANVTQNGKTKDLDGTELDKRINSALKRVETLTKRAPEKGTSEERPTDVRKLN
jgi:hypothetical protein